MAEFSQSEPAVLSKPRKGLLLEFDDAWTDISRGFKLWPIWITLAWVEFNATYKRSIIGFLWVILSFAAYIFIKITIFSSLLIDTEPGYYDAYLVLGIFTWQFLSPSISAAPDSFVSAQGWIRSEPLPYSIYIFKTIMREFYNLALTFLVALAALIYIGLEFSVTALWAFLAVAMYLITTFSLKLMLGVIGARFRDTSHLFKAIMLPMMFLTPIFWMPSQMPGLMKYLWWNPLYHFIELFRAPILDGRFPTESWIFCGCVYAAITIAALGLFARFRARIVFWF